MRKLAKISAAAGTVLSSASLLVTKVAAQDWDWSYSSADAGLSSAFCFGNMIVTICCGLLGLVMLAFNIWMLIDVVQRDEKILPGKVKWLLVILFVPFGSVAYYFMRKKKMDEMSK